MTTHQIFTHQVMYLYSLTKFGHIKLSMEKALSVQKENESVDSPYLVACGHTLRVFITCCMCGHLVEYNMLLLITAYLKWSISNVMT